jgi:hypothetical protein
MSLLKRLICQIQAHSIYRDGNQVKWSVPLRIGWSSRQWRIYISVSRILVTRFFTRLLISARLYNFAVMLVTHESVDRLRASEERNFVLAWYACTVLDALREFVLQRTSVADLVCVCVCVCACVRVRSRQHLNSQMNHRWVRDSEMVQGSSGFCVSLWLM